ncbi:unnamed protein product [Vitrella brassicaformis CCMP3155]|uniref:Uncharacterized protein n=1 Tax=Vitrella brassicaformis (strain CCMP3155) TaxID=1169540 RepID=A0A0G4EBV5_VITBC|nr:unnamed protein product [Vitrella brassicaformis CCMP3155]|eukprot:CEL92785.1 unnamed protein product [Vitrella brassicaformis CCMP3155]
MEQGKTPTTEPGRKEEDLLAELHEISGAYRRRIQKRQEVEDAYEACMALKAANEKREEAINRRRGEQQKKRAVDEHDLAIDAAVAAYIAANRDAEIVLRHSAPPRPRQTFATHARIVLKQPPAAAGGTVYLDNLAGDYVRGAATACRVDPTRPDHVFDGNRLIIGSRRAPLRTLRWFEQLPQGSIPHQRYRPWFDTKSGMYDLQSLLPPREDGRPALPNAAYRHGDGRKVQASPLSVDYYENLNNLDIHTWINRHAENSSALFLAEVRGNGVAGRLQTLTAMGGRVRGVIFQERVELLADGHSIPTGCPQCRWSGVTGPMSTRFAAVAATASSTATSWLPASQRERPTPTSTTTSRRPIAAFILYFGVDFFYSSARMLKGSTLSRKKAPKVTCPSTEQSSETTRRICSGMPIMEGTPACMRSWKGAIVEEKEKEKEREQRRWPHAQPPLPP